MHFFTGVSLIVLNGTYFWVDVIGLSCQPSLLQAKHTKFPQPFPVGLILQPSDHPCCSSLNSLQRLIQFLLLFPGFCNSQGNRIKIKMISAHIQISENVEMECESSLDAGIYWIHQDADNTLQSIVYVNSRGKLTPEGCVDFIPTKSGTTYKLTVKKFQKEREGIYYCAAHQGQTLIFSSSLQVYLPGKLSGPPHILYPTPDASLASFLSVLFWKVREGVCSLPALSRLVLLPWKIFQGVSFSPLPSSDFKRWDKCCVTILFWLYTWPQSWSSRQRLWSPRGRRWVLRPLLSLVNK